jgi:hypothetical protein
VRTIPEITASCKHAGPCDEVGSIEHNRHEIEKNGKKFKDLGLISTHV